MRRHRVWIRGALTLLVTVTLVGPDAFAQGTAPVTVTKDVTAVRQVLALTYPEGPTLSIRFEGTTRLPGASGEAKVERKRGMTEIEIELDEMKPAIFFGGDYTTYVLWVVSPEGHVDNVGEFILDGNRSKLNVSTPLETFGMFVSAEPHFLVDRPSRFVVLDNSEPTVPTGRLKISRLEYRGFDGRYRFDNESLANMMEAKGEARAHLESARAAVALAERADAGAYASEELEEARVALQHAERAVTDGISPQNEMLMAHEAVRLAVTAQQLTKERAFDAALAREREANGTEIASLEQSLTAAETDAERARIEAEQRALQAEMEARARREAQQRADEAVHRAARAEQKASQAETAAAIAAHDREEARSQLRAALEEISDVRETARGLIVNIPHVLFDFDQATLTPRGRETLAHIGGVLQIAKDYRLMIEGHTDGLGSHEYNYELGWERAMSVRDYLVAGGVNAELVTVESLGETQPVATNDTDANRQQNRRVEIVVTEGPNFALPTSQ